MAKGRDLYMCTWPRAGTYTCVHGQGQGPIHVYMARGRDLYMCTWPGPGTYICVHGQGQGLYMFTWPGPGTYTCVHGQGQGPIHVYMARARDLYMCTYRSVFGVARAARAYTCVHGQGLSLQASKAHNYKIIITSCVGGWGGGGTGRETERQKGVVVQYCNTLSVSLCACISHYQAGPGRQTATSNGTCWAAMPRV